MAAVRAPAPERLSAGPGGRGGSRDGPRRPNHARAVAVAVLVALLVAGVWAEVSVRVSLRNARQALGALEGQLTSVEHRISSAEKGIGRATFERAWLGAALGEARNDLASASSSLSAAQRIAYIQGAGLQTLRACLDGVQRALDQIAANDRSGAIASLQASQPSCEVVEVGSQGAEGLVYPFDFADPDVIRVGGTYYAYATNAAGGNIQAISSSNHVNWTADGDVLPNLATWAVPNKTWAPGVIHLGSTFVLYYTASYGLTGRDCIGAAVSLLPLGPFVDNSPTPLVCQPDLGGSIDPSPYRDASGTPYLAWVSDGAGGTLGSGPAIWSQQLTANGLGLVGTPSDLIHSDQTWEDGVVEGPSLVYYGGDFYLFYSANDWSSAKYAIGFAVCQGPLGPCTKPTSGPILTSAGKMAGPGGPSVFDDPGGGLWLAFHAYVAPNIGFPNSRELFVRSLSIRGGVANVGP